MTDLKPNIIFKVIDPLFLKAGKPLARQFAKKDKTEDIILKRENRSKMVVFMALKYIKYSYTIMEAAYIIACSVWVAYLCIFFSSFFISLYKQTVFTNISDISFMFPPALLGIVSTIMANSSSRQKKRFAIATFFYKSDMIHAMKTDKYRWESFFAKNEKFIFSGLVSNVFALYFGFSILEQRHLSVHSLFSIGFYLLAVLVISVNWVGNYLLAAAIYHCDDTGTKEKKKAKEQKYNIVTNAA